jgi:N-acetylglucosamine-6-sulfatase
MDGHSLVPLLTGEMVNERNSFLIEYYSDIVFPYVQNMGYQAVRTPEYKFIHYIEQKDMDELYDLQNDPYEMNNVINQADYKNTLTEMKAELARLVSN